MLWEWNLVDSCRRDSQHLHSLAPPARAGVRAVQVWRLEAASGSAPEIMEALFGKEGGSTSTTKERIPKKRGHEVHEGEEIKI